MAYPEPFCYILPPGPDQLPLAAVKAKTWRQHPYPSYVGQVQGVPPSRPGWFPSFCGYLLGKDQEGLPVPTRGSLWLDSPPRALASNPPRVWSRRHSEGGDHDPILPERAKAFCPGPVGCPRQGPRLLERGHRESRQCRGKGVAVIFRQHPRHGFKVSQEEQAR